MVYFNETARAERVMALYRELPALRLSLIQAARLLSMPVAECSLVLQQLVVSGRLYQTADGCCVATPAAEVACSVLNTPDTGDLASLNVPPRVQASAVLDTREAPII